jgi:hypothetical protein
MQPLGFHTDRDSMIRWLPGNCRCLLSTDVRAVLDALPRFHPGQDRQVAERDEPEQAEVHKTKQKRRRKRRGDIEAPASNPVALTNVFETNI